MESIEVPSVKNYYQILQVDPLADPEVIAAAYKRLSLKYHPDTNPTQDANLRMQEINEAYQVLSNPARRRQYDLRRSGAVDGSSPGTGGQMGGRPKERSSKPTTRPDQALAQMIISLTFPITYALAAFVLFRFFRAYNIVVFAAVLVAAGLIAYSVSRSVEKVLRK